jgi:hypothetical protein
LTDRLEIVGRHDEVEAAAPFSRAFKTLVGQSPAA